MTAAVTFTGVLAEQFVGSDSSRWAIVAATVGGTAALVATFGVLLGRRQADVERRLAGYHVAVADEPPTSATEPQTAIVQQGVDLASRLAARSGLLGRTERMLEQADLPIRAGELLFYAPMLSVFAFLFLSIVFDAIVGLLGAVICLVLPFAVISRRRATRLKAFERMLPPTLTLLASSMRAGFSLMQSLETVTQDSPEPVRREFHRVFTEVRLGRPVEEALADVAERMHSSDLAWTVMAIRIQREVGGNLAALLDTVADTMTKREQLRREIQTLTAEGRLSAVVLSLFPPLMLGVLYLMQSSYIEKLFDDILGIAALVGAGGLSIAGWVWLSRIINIEA